MSNFLFINNLNTKYINVDLINTNKSTIFANTKTIRHTPFFKSNLIIYSVDLGRDYKNILYTMPHALGNDYIKCDGYI